MVATFLCHGAAMLSMALWLAPMLPGGGTADDGDRVRMIGERPWLFWLGWLPWHLTAVSDVALAIGLLRARWVPRPAAWVSLVLTCLAVLPDQIGQILLETRGVSLAQMAVEARSVEAYGAFFAFESQVFPYISAWAALLYTLSGITWSWAFWGAGVWSETIEKVSTVLWTVFLVVSIGPMLPARFRPAAELVALGNAVAFVGLMLWLGLVSERLLCRRRPETAHGRWAKWLYPHDGLLATMIDRLAASRFARAIGELCPTPPLRSDITDVIYINYLVPAAQLEGLLPEGLSLQRVGERRAHAVLSALTYHHGHLGPALLGPLRRLFGSPLQSNWRLYVRDDHTGMEGIYFITTAISSPVYALAARLLSGSAPMHIPASLRLDRAASGEVRLLMEPGKGTAPDLNVALRPATARSLPAAWRACFDSYEAMLAHVVPQDRAITIEPWDHRSRRQEISLGIALTDCEPLTGEVRSRSLVALAASDEDALCFRVPVVRFLMQAELVDDWNEG